MTFRNLTISALASAFLLVSSAALAADKDQVKDKTQDQTQLRDQDRIFGSQLMTEQERIEHRNKMRNFKTQQEREAYQLEHHKLMQARAKEKGVTLPDEPIMRPGSMGPGSGMSPGSMGGRK